MTMAPIAVEFVSNAIQRAGLELHLVDGRLVCRGRREDYSEHLRSLVKAHRPELIRYLSSQEPPQEEPVILEFPADAWDAALAAAMAAIDQAQWDPRLADVQRRVLGYYRTVAKKHHDNRDPALFGWADEVRYEMEVIWRLAPRGLANDMEKQHERS